MAKPFCYTTAGNGTREIRDLTELVTHRNSKARRMRMMMDSPEMRGGRPSIMDLRNEINDIDDIIFRVAGIDTPNTEAWQLIDPSNPAQLLASA